MKNKGFSLVELIVVIAIMAILVGVAVPVYTSYIEKANKSKDIQMVDEITHALQIAGAANTFAEGEGGYLILSTRGVSGVEPGSNLDNVLKATFGDDYATTLKLSYGEWGNNGLYAGLAGGAAENVYNSTYYGVSDQLMGQVKDITDAATQLVENVSDGTLREQMISMFGGVDGTSEFLNQAATLYGYEDFNAVGDDELANFMVLAVALDMTMMADDPEYEGFEATGLIESFALYNGYASTEQGKAEGFDIAYNEFVANLGAATNVDEVADAYRDLRDASQATAGYASYKASQGEVDVEAFSAMMNGLTGSTIGENAEKVKADLSNENFFTTGVGNSLFGNYIDSVDSFVGIDFADETVLQEFFDAMAEDGVVGIFFTNSENGIVINNSFPIE